MHYCCRACHQSGCMCASAIYCQMDTGSLSLSLSLSLRPLPTESLSLSLATPAAHRVAPVHHAPACRALRVRRHSVRSYALCVWCAIQHEARAGPGGPGPGGMHGGVPRSRYSSVGAAAVGAAPVGAAPPASCWRAGFPPPFGQTGRGGAAGRPSRRDGPVSRPRDLQPAGGPGWAGGPA